MSQVPNIGLFSRKISLCVATTTKTAMGAPAKGFSHSFYMKASREQVGSGNEQYINNRLVSPYNYKYRTHYKSRELINETMRIIDDSETFNILSVTPDDFKMFLEIFVEKVTE